MARFGFWADVMLVGALGATLGQLVTVKRAGACSCATPTWHLTLAQVSSSDPNTSHAGFWPQRAILNAYTGHAIISADSDEAGVVSRAEAGRP